MFALSNPIKGRHLLGGLACLTLASAPAVLSAQELTMSYLASYKTATDQAIAGFEATNPGIKIRASYTADGQSIRAQLTTGNAPDITLVYPGDGSPMALIQLAKAGMLEDLSAEPWARTVPQSFRRAVTLNGKV